MALGSILAPQDWAEYCSHAHAWTSQMKLRSSKKPMSSRPKRYPYRVIHGDENHVMTCPGCEEQFDMRDLDQVMKHTHGDSVPFVWHEKPLKLDDRSRQPDHGDDGNDGDQKRNASGYRVPG